MILKHFFGLFQVMDNPIREFIFESKILILFWRQAVGKRKTHLFRINLILSWVCGETILFRDPIMNGFAGIQQTFASKCLKLTLLSKRKQVNVPQPTTKKLQKTFRDLSRTTSCPQWARRAVRKALPLIGGLQSDPRSGSRLPFPADPEAEGEEIMSVMTQAIGVTSPLHSQ